MKLYIYHTPELTPTDSLPDCAIAVDVLRATSTMATALNAGAEGVQVFSDIDELMQVSEAWPAEKRLRAGERGGAQVEGCDMGNSPFDCTPERVKECRMFMSTTNGTRALKCIQKAPIVLAAALINRQAVVEFVHEQKPETIWIVGSGWEGSFSLEDTVCAGAIAHRLMMATGVTIGDIAGNDETVSAIALYQQWEDDLLGLMEVASHGQRLLRLNRDEDLKYCAQTDILDVVPIQKELGVLGKH